MEWLALIVFFGFAIHKWGEARDKAGFERARKGLRASIYLTNKVRPICRKLILETRGIDAFNLFEDEILSDNDADHAIATFKEICRGRQTTTLYTDDLFALDLASINRNDHEIVAKKLVAEFFRKNPKIASDCPF